MQGLFDLESQGDKDHNHERTLSLAKTFFYL